MLQEKGCENFLKKVPMDIVNLSNGVRRTIEPERQLGYIRTLRKVLRYYDHRLEDLEKQLEHARIAKNEKPPLLSADEL